MLATKRNDTLTTIASDTSRADELIAGLSEQSWRRLSVGAGAHGPRIYDWARIPLGAQWPPGRGRQGVRCSRKRVERIMRENGLVGAHLRRGWKTGSTRQNPHHDAAPDLVGRDFTATAPNRLWVADLTRRRTLPR